MAVGTKPVLAAQHAGVVEVDFGDAVLLPTLVNAHAHLELTDFPVWADACDASPDSNSFVDWILHLVRVRKQVETEQFRLSLLAGMRDSLAVGVGAVGDILTSYEIASVYGGSPLRGRVFCELLGRDQQQVAARLSQLDRLITTPPTAELSWGVSPHAPYTLAEATALQISAYATAHHLPMAMHLAETSEEVAFLERAEGPIAEMLYTAAGWEVTVADGGHSPIEWALQTGCLPTGGLVVHGVHVNETDMELIARQACSVALCPRSNSLFGETRAPLAAYRAAGVNLALGTDSRASSPSLSIWGELAFARQWFAGLLSPSEWLEIATLGGAHALGLESVTGSLDVDKQADFQVVPMLEGASSLDLEEALCAQGETAQVQEVFLSGQSV